MRLSAALKGSFVAGLILLTPLVVTVFVLKVLVNWSLQFVNPVVQGTRLTQYTANIEVVAQLVAALLIVAGVTLLGYLAQRSIGQELFGNIGRLVNVVPLVSTVYVSVRQVANSLVERQTAYEGVALVEYPKEGSYCIGLVTGESPESVSEFVGQETFNVFIPNSPNPTGGRLLLLPADQVHEIDMSVRRGMRLIVTTGMGDDADPMPVPSVGDQVD